MTPHSGPALTSRLPAALAPPAGLVSVRLVRRFPVRRIVAAVLPVRPAVPVFVSVGCLAACAMFLLTGRRGAGQASA
ncbi:hypothetical protein ACFQ36_10260 [Arthrobacter sp. GCM10027362]|uniref:hypothetical protein n=1 Tax=Arthrobacter sp. GCM10027362 TaxID=3273379 RepID=UPI003640A4DB